MGAIPLNRYKTEYCGNKRGEVFDSSRFDRSQIANAHLFLLLLAASSTAFALDSSRTIAQLYRHCSWTIGQWGPSRYYALAQTKDGYLSARTHSGLFRFDGVRFERYQPERGDPFPSQDISQLLATPDGGLWIGFRPYGAVFLENGRGRSYGEKEDPLSGIYALALDREGAIWAGSPRGLFRFTDSHWEKIGAERGFSGEQAIRLFVDKQGKLWVNGDTDLYCLSPGSHAFQMRKIPHGWLMNQTPDGTLWMWEIDKGIKSGLRPTGGVLRRIEGDGRPGTQSDSGGPRGRVLDERRRSGRAAPRFELGTATKRTYRFDQQPCPEI